ncbi:sugar phosphate nucleotidyltransferase [Curtobacterium luteum]|uniref:sugar phosphate nucleotidyltransferase n=1 Tax=Curtobacterium luteum TaxID=33881 RepID=UPI0038171999
MQAVVLAGGLGTRLRGAIPDAIPKPMAEVAGRPFLSWLLDRFVGSGATDIVLLVGHRAEAITSVIGDRWRGVPVRYSTELRPLGTGGALSAALPLLAERFIVANGDTVVDCDLRQLLRTTDRDAFAMAVAAVPDVARFGGVRVDAGRALELVEKGPSGPGTINAGVYAMRRSFVESFPDRRPLSFERDVMESHVRASHPPVVRATGTFFDIGVPADLVAADRWFRRT